MPERDVIAKSTAGPVVHDRLVAELRQLGILPGVTLLVHSSLSALGWVVGGAQTVVETLLESVGAEGTLVLPTHSANTTDPSEWSNPPVDPEWWTTIRESMPGFDADLTPTRGMGAIPETFRKAKGVLRSAHPHVSFAALGPHAARITREHALDSALGERSPLARIYELGGSVLLLGVRHEANTSLHLSEYRAEYPSKKITRQGAPLQRKGTSHWTEFEDLDFSCDDFEQIGASFEEEHQLSQCKVGYADAMLFPLVDIVDYGVQWMSSHRT